MRNILLPLILVLILPLVATAQNNPPAQPQPYNQAEWNEVLNAFLKLYYSPLPEKRTQAMQSIDNIFNRLVFSDKKYAFEMLEYQLDYFATEDNESVLTATMQSFNRFLLYPEYVGWVAQNYKKLINKEPAQMRFMDALVYFALIYKNNCDTVLPLLTEMLGKDEPGPVRLRCINILTQNFQSKAIDILLNLVKDADVTICKAALNALAGLRPWEKLDKLIKLLGEEQRKEIKDEIGATMERITGESYKTDVSAWQRWLEKSPLSNAVPRLEVEDAIYRGVTYLIGERRKMFNWGVAVTHTQEAELVLYTLVKSGVAIPDDVKDRLLDELLQTPLERTYNVALQAIALNELDHNKYIARIVQCAEFLMANQSTMGNWHYGEPLRRYINTGITGTAISPITGSTVVVKKIKIKIPRRRKDNDYDNSNTQYALLGLKACAEAGIEIPDKVWADAKKHLMSSQSGDGGWAYQAGSPGYGSMTAGGLGGLAICKFYLGEDIANDKNVFRGINWLAKNFTVTENPKQGTNWHYYYLYGLERAGVLLSVKTFGAHEWYPVGARFLLREQKADGSWGAMLTEDTCFAILFLRRATRPLKLITTEDTKK